VTAIAGPAARTTTRHPLTAPTITALTTAITTIRLVVTFPWALAKRSVTARPEWRIMAVQSTGLGIGTWQIWEWQPLAGGLAAMVSLLLAGEWLRDDE
jgi:hypothetical protein